MLKPLNFIPQTLQTSVPGYKGVILFAYSS